jgi:hypothetical protein
LLNDRVLKRGASSMVLVWAGLPQERSLQARGDAHQSVRVGKFCREMLLQFAIVVDGLRRGLVIIIRSSLSLCCVLVLDLVHPSLVHKGKKFV